jgi:hypothetical protein
MLSSFHSSFDTGALPDDARESFRTALRLAAEKGGRAWITEDGEVVAQLALTSALADETVRAVTQNPP